jgi:hypothetical protein
MLSGRSLEVPAGPLPRGRAREGGKEGIYPVFILAGFGLMIVRQRVA